MSIWSRITDTWLAFAIQSTRVFAAFSAPQVVTDQAVNHIAQSFDRRAWYDQWLSWVEPSPANGQAKIRVLLSIPGSYRKLINGLTLQRRSAQSKNIGLGINKIMIFNHNDLKQPISEQVIYMLDFREKFLEKSALRRVQMPYRNTKWAMYIIYFSKCATYAKVQRLWGLL